MDFSYSDIQLHPEAKTTLFQHYDALTKIFQDVLGLFEIDYISIALLNARHELLFLSSKPSIERNLIEKDLWKHDGSYHIDFFSQQDMKRWDELYSNQFKNELYLYKQKIPKFHMGFSIPSSYEGIKLVYSFAIISDYSEIAKKILHNPDMMIRMGRFCLQKITKKIALPGFQQSYTPQKPFLRLIINNEVCCDNNT